MADKRNQMPAPDGSATAEAVASAPGELEQMLTRLTEAEQARDQHLDLAKRTQAEFENYQKRSQRDSAQALRYAQAPLAFDILGALDNLDREDAMQMSALAMAYIATQRPNDG